MFFSSILPLLRQCKEIKTSISLTETDLIRVVVTPSRAKGADAVLSHPLVLTGTAEELDAEFHTAASSYNLAHASLAEQVEATATLLKAAEKNQAGKATKAIGKNQPAALPAPATTSIPTTADADAEDDEMFGSTPPGGTGESSGPASSEAATAQPAAGTDLLSLLS